MSAEEHPQWIKEPAPLLGFANERALGQFRERYYCEPYPGIKVHVFQSVPHRNKDEKAIIIFDNRQGHTIDKSFHADGWLQAASLIHDYLNNLEK